MVIRRKLYGSPIFGNPDTKYCKECQTSKPVEAFGISNHKYRSRRCLECDARRNREYHQKWRKEHPEEHKAYGKNYYRKNRGKLLTESRNYRQATKAKVLSHYGPNGEIRCSWPGCDISDMDMLSLDHINNDGAAHRRQMYGNNKGHSTYDQHLWVIREGFPEGFQTLCMNHQFKKQALFRQSQHDKTLSE